MSFRTTYTDSRTENKVQDAYFDKSTLYSKYRAAYTDYFKYKYHRLPPHYSSLKGLTAKQVGFLRIKEMAAEALEIKIHEMLKFRDALHIISLVRSECWQKIGFGKKWKEEQEKIRKQYEDSPTPVSTLFGTFGGETN